MAVSEGKAGVTSQTLERGLAALEVVARTGPCSATDVAQALGLHRSITYRLLTTLETRGYLERDDVGRYQVGLAPVMVAAAVRRDLRSIAEPIVRRVAEELNTTAFLVVPQGEEALTLVSIEPVESPSAITYRPGLRHPLTRGAPGLAVLAALPPRDEERPEVTLTRELGYVRTTGEVVPGLSAIAVPVVPRQGQVASLCVMFIPGTLDDKRAVDALVAAADELHGQ
ncbi:transcriptional regulator, IclR family protein (plasmid) [Rhodococcus jostii RHA1]|uniref:Transcriptional regulator, IclR family protein n=1 Tax=Rhodococcus jostii (strain RHA1) TaxID=101510 RepID=Q0RX82_RHOJR|nr:IclR family transcriptional regulator [Rhodococcus jostii]ABH00104.1 transcriptional regulator, IclR family protein [Rhodococcus jostii RHA1]